MNGKSKKIGGPGVFRLALEVGEFVWNTVLKWDSFAKELWVSSLLRPPILSQQILQKDTVDTFIRIGNYFATIAAAHFWKQKTGLANHSIEIC